MMTAHRVPFFIVFFMSIPFVGGAFAQEIAKDCIETQGPNFFAFKGPPTENFETPVNRGIVPNGFVGLRDNRPIVHGIDVSKWNDKVDFVRAKSCGAKFSFVRISAGRNPDNELAYRSHWSNARFVDMHVGPYHNLALLRSVVRANGIGEYSAAEVNALIRENEIYARQQAVTFVERLGELLSLDPLSLNDDVDKYVGGKFLPPILDASLRPQLKGNDRDRKVAGKVYRAAICAWMGEVVSYDLTKNVDLMLFTFPMINEVYDLDHSECSADVDIWVSHHNVDGGPLEAVSDPQHDQIARLCESNTDPGRCRFHQYTSLGGFALFQKEAGLDMNRFFGDMDDLEDLLQRGRVARQ